MSEIIACFFGKSDLKQLHDATQNSDLLIKFIIVKQINRENVQYYNEGSCDLLAIIK